MKNILSHIKRSFSPLILLCGILCSCTSIEQIPPAGTELPAAESETVSGPFASETDISAPASEISQTQSVNYIYDNLSEKEKKFYDELKEAAKAHSHSVRFSEDIDAATARKIFIAVYNQEPEIFWLDSIFYAPTGNIQPLSYRFSADEAESMQREMDMVTQRLLSETEGLSDYQKVLAFHDHLVLNCSFSTNDRYSGTVYGCLCGGYAQCEGYAFAFRYLCSLADIDCITVTGSDENGSSHAWNLVKLDDIWYNIDCTWDDPILDPPDPTFIRRYYVLVSDSEILGISHFRSDEYFSYPPCYDSSRNYYAREDLIASSVSDGYKKLERSVETALAAGLYDAEVRFDSASAYYTASSQIMNAAELSNIISRAAAANGMSGRVNTGRFVRYLNDDLRIIHIKMFPE